MSEWPFAVSQVPGVGQQEKFLHQKENQALAQGSHHLWGYLKVL